MNVLSKSVDVENNKNKILITNQKSNDENLKTEVTVMESCYKSFDQNKDQPKTVKYRKHKELTRPVTSNRPETANNVYFRRFSKQNETVSYGDRATS